MKPDQTLTLVNIPTPQDLQKWLTIFQHRTNEILNRGILFQDNVRCSISQGVTINGSGSDTRIDHNLGSIPLGYVVIKRNGNFQVYDGTTAWTSNSIYLRSSSSGVVNLIVLAG